jgi:aldose 1-epimerase
MSDTRVFTLGDGAGTTLSIGEIGAAWLSCRVPMGDGRSREVLLAPPAPGDVLDEPGYLGVVVGRYANRIANARFTLEGRTYALAPNEGANQLHGGPDGFDKRRWALISHSERELQLALSSPDRDQGYPGNLEARVTYAIEGPGRIALRFAATVDQPCPVNLTSHAYFNLDDADASDTPSIREHRFGLRASRYLPVDEALIPTGEWAPVDGTRFDLRPLQTLGVQTFDHCFLLDGGDGPDAEVWSTDRRLRMRLRTSYPGLQFYTGQYLAGTRGRRGTPYPAGAGFALEPQFLPDAPNHPEWPGAARCVLRPGQRLDATMQLEFTAFAR